MSARRIVLCLPAGMPCADPAPDETARRDVELVDSWHGTPAGVVGVAEGGLRAVALAAAHPELVDRLVLVATRAPEREPPGAELDAVRAKTLLLFVQGDPDIGQADGKWWLKRLAHTRLEMVSRGGADLLPRVWPRVLSHVASHTLR